MQHELGITWAISTTLTGLGTAEVLGSGEGQIGGVERGVKLLGAVAALLETTRAVMESGTRATYERGVAAGRARLSEADFEKTWEEGRSLGIEDAVEYALKEG